MKKREFIKAAAAIGLTSLLNPFSSIASGSLSRFDIKADPFSLPSLPYAEEALEPYIDRQTMNIHHTKHHKSYVTKLNEAVSGTPHEKKTIEELCKNAGSLSTAIRNNGGGHYNHSLFWKLLAPKSSGKPSGKLLESINTSFGSFDKFKEEFSTAATTRFGSGWAWLSLDDSNKLFISSTPNQDNPLMDVAEKRGFPILGLDVWEHAYYLKYQNKRAEYIEAFWKIVNWDEVEKRFAGKG